MGLEKTARRLQGRAELRGDLAGEKVDRYEELSRAGSQCSPSAVIPPPVMSRCTWG